jgi:hypothetical protein
MRPSRAQKVERSVRWNGILATCVAIAALIWGGQARAVEGGASVYLLGAGGPEAAILPPLQGVFFDNQIYVYDGSASGNKDFVVGGNLVAGLKAHIAADFPAVLWVPTTNFAGGVLALGGVAPFGQPNVNVSAVLTGPLGHRFGISRSDSAFVAGDPLVTASLGWTSGDLHVTASGLLNIPVGDYRQGELANLAFHRWALDQSLAATWHDDKSGWDVSGKAGVTFNGTNGVTHYASGDEFHIEGSIEKTFVPAFSAGIQAYYYDQITGDSGSGAALGPFEGRVVGVGGSAAYHFSLFKMPATLRFRGMSEFDAVNRLQGESFDLDLSFPLYMKLPSAP